MNQPHKRAKEIKAWADGATIQFRRHETDPWEDCFGEFRWDLNGYYQIKPKIELVDGQWYLVRNIHYDINGSHLLMAKYSTEWGRFMHMNGQWWHKDNCAVLSTITLDPEIDI